VSYAFDATSTTMTDKMTRRTKERPTRADLRGATPSFWLAGTASGAGATRYLDDNSQ
jgi:hypothetical protein